jgi:DNA-binding LytR/AlgR family response regulator
MKDGKLAVDDMIIVGEGYKGQLVRVGNISTIEVDGNDITVRVNGGERVTTRCSLARCKQRLPEHFFVTGRNCMVNLAEVSKVNMASRTFVLTMKDGTVVPVSRHQSRVLKKGLSL